MLQIDLDYFMITKKFDINGEEVLQYYQSIEYNLSIQRYYCWQNKKWCDYLDIGCCWLHNQGTKVDLATSYRRYKFLAAIKKSLVLSITKIYKTNKKKQKQTWLILGSLKRRPIRNCKLINIFNLQNHLQTSNIPNLLSMYFTKDQQNYWLKELNYK